MSSAIPASLEEALLLVNKWVSELTTLIMLQAFMCPPALGSELQSGTLFRITGRIAHMEESTGTFTFVSRENDFVMVSPSGCSFGYSGQSPVAKILQKYLPSEWGSYLTLQFPNGSVLVIFELTAVRESPNEKPA